MNDLPFLRAIIARPADDLPRLIYADWLDENGQSERAEFIRVQCAVALLPEPAELTAGIDLDPAEARRRACVECRKLPRGQLCAWHTLRRRERELLEQHGETWALREIVRPANIEVGGRRNWLHYRGVSDQRPEAERPVTRPGESTWRWEWDWTRGFVEALRCTWADCAAHLDAIRERTPLRKVTLTTRPPESIIEWPFGVMQSDGAYRSDRWPGIEFELPAGQGPLLLSDWTVADSPQAVVDAIRSVQVTLRGPNRHFVIAGVRPD